MKNNNISKSEILEDLFSKNRMGIKPGLERTLELSNFVNNPHNSFKTIHVAGTNGKGTICSTIASILMESGYKVGLYTSPHLVDFNERIRVNDNLIPDEKLIEYYILLKDKSEEIGATFFEITTIMAFMYFREMGVEIAVIETGMGGRYDSTNIINPILSIIAKIDYDHQEFLGDTIEKIAWEKAGIIKKDTPCVVAKNIQEVYNILKNEVESDSQLIFSEEKIKLVQVNGLLDFKSHWQILNSNLDLKKFDFPILGVNQIHNLTTILCAIEVLSKSLNITTNSIKNGLENVVKNCGLRGRIELIDKDRNIILDGSHNAGNIENLFYTLEKIYPEKKWNIIFAIMADKDISPALKNIKKYSKSLILPRLKIKRALDNTKIRDIANEYGIENIILVNSVSEAISYTNELKDIIIFGSFYLAGEVLELEKYKLK